MLSRSSFTVCQWKSSNRLPNDTRSWPPEKELIPENKLKNKQNLLKNQDFTETIWNLLYNILLLMQWAASSTWHIIVPSLDRGSGCFRNGLVSNTTKVTVKIHSQMLQLPHYTEVEVLLFKTYFGRILNHLQDSRTAMSLYPRVPAKLYFLNNWYLYLCFKLYYLWK